MSAAVTRRALFALHAVMLLVSFTVLLFELTLTRVLSVTMWYHFAFLTIALALLGTSVAAVVVFLRGRVLLERATTVLPVLCGALALALVCVPALYLAFDLRASLTLAGGARLATALLLFLVPYTLGGAVIALLLSAWPGRIASLYFADLVGAGLGCVAAVPLLNRVPAPLLLALTAVVPALAAVAALGAAPRPRRRAGAVLGATAVAVLGVGLAVAVAGSPRSPYRVRHTKSYEEHEVIHERWNALARLTVYRGVFFMPAPQHAFGWGLSRHLLGFAADQYWVEQDGSAGTPITRFSGELSFRDFPQLAADVTAVAYVTRERPFPDALIVGAGGGRDVLAARLFGTPHITAVEINPAMVDLVNGRFGDFSGRPYRLPGVTAVVGEARSYLRRTPARYGLIQLSLTDSWAASVAGAYVLAENNLYTREAFRLYLDRLRDDGVLTVSRWYRGEHRHETVRTVALALAALEDLGVAEPRRHLAVIQAHAWVATVLVRRTPFPAEETRRLRAAARLADFGVVWAADDPALAGGAPDPVRAVIANPDWRAAIAASPLDLSPPTDDRPFFFQVQRRPLRWSMGETSGGLAHNDESTAVLTLLLLIVAGLSLGLVLVPLWIWQRRRGSVGVPRGLVVRTMLYFGAIGLGFMVIEVALIQRFILFLGHPIYATSVVLFALLLAGGCGSGLAGRFPSEAGRYRAHVVALALLGTVVVLTLGFGAHLLAACQDLGRPARIVLAVAMLLPPGLLMGMQLPFGLLRLGAQGGAPLVPWAWAVNGVCSVLGSVLAMVLAIWQGYAFCLGVGAVAYAVALLVVGATAGATPPATPPQPCTGGSPGSGPQ